MSQIFSGIGNVLGKINPSVGTPPFIPSGTGGGGWRDTLGKVANLGLLGFGVAQDQILRSRQGQIFDQYNNMLRQYSDPAALAARIQALQQPLSLGLKQNVGNAVQAMMAERGLGQAPGLFESALVQALAPYALEQQKLAIEAATPPASLNPAMGLGAIYGQKPNDLSGQIQKLGAMWGNNNNNASAPTGIADFPLPQAPSVFYPQVGAPSGFNGGSN